MTIFCQAIENELIQLGHELSGCQWKIGHIVKAHIDQVGSDRMTIYSDAAKLTGKSARSIRRYYAVADFYPPVTYLQYNVLSFEHFAVAMTYGPRWRELLDACLEQMDHNGGGVPSVDWLEAYASPNITTALEIDHLAETPPPPADDPLEYLDQETQPATISPAAIRSAIGHTKDLLQAIIRIINSIPVVPEDALSGFIAASDQMDASLREIAQSLQVAA